MTDFLNDLRDRLPEGELGDWLWPVVLVAAGLIVARITSILVRRIIEGIANGRVAMFERALAGVGPTASLSAITGRIAFWGVLIFFVAQAATTAELGLLTEMVDSAVRVIPVVALGAAILLAGAIAGDRLGALAGSLADRSSAIPRGLASAIVRVSLIVGAAIVAFDTMGLATILPVTVVSLFVAAILTLIVAAVVVASRGVLGNIAAARYVEETYLEGERVLFRNEPAEVQAIGLLATELVTDAGLVIRVPNQVLVSEAA